ncbi:MAG TPA: DEAD/DEAH box helicase [Saprospiraceae bacterium]|nr:DEAD/DEAH box helicase [Saprospiraceae bacterium]
MSTEENKKPIRKTRAKKTTRKKKKKKRVSFYSKPLEMDIDKWQYELRKQFGIESKFKLENLGEHPCFSDFKVLNPETNNSYRVTIRGREGAPNFCECLDFKTNQLNICKHLAFVINKLERKRGYKKIFKEGFDKTHSSIYLDYQNGRRIRFSIGTEEAAAFQTLAQQYFDENMFLLETSFAKFENLLAEAKKISPSFKCYDDALEFVLTKRDSIRRRAHLDIIFAPDKKEAQFKKLLKTNLFDYQQDGVLFAARAGRCLIADEMGLGKTIQALAVSELYQQEFKTSKVLIVCPTSLKYQWKSEIEKFTNNSAHVVEGHHLKRIQQYKNVDAYYMIMGYHTVGRDLPYINDMDVDIIILDEAQRIKNWKTKRSYAIKKLKSPYAFVLTGTPLENKLEELYSIMQVIDQFRLGPLYRFLHRYQITEPDSGKIIGYTNLHEIGKNLSDVLLRRTKAQVIQQMPKRMDKILLVPMTKDQAIVHEEHGDAVAKLVAKWRRMKFLDEKDRRRLMLNLSMMRMVCDSTYIIDQKTRHDTKIDELMCVLEEFFANNPKEKVVIFSQWKRMNHLVAKELEERNMPYQYLHGAVPSIKRDDLLKTFKEDPSCQVFLSTDAGGVGLNLQSASLVISLDVPWNPAILEQRIARVYRLGQKRPVQVINLVSAGTIEHRMLDTLKFKASLSKGVLDGGEDAIFLSESKFSKFMGKVEDMTAGNWVSDDTRIDEAAEEEVETTTKPSSPPVAPSFLGDDDVVTPETPKAQPRNNNTSTTTIPSSANELVQAGMAFFQGLSNTLSDPVATQNLVKSITAKDEKTGKTYLKIPIENEKLIQNAFQILGGLFNAMK